MVRKDLEAVGIPYTTKDGDADFHAAGRHSHITELLLNGATLVEAKELARHKDVRMTMRYIHIGLKDQAKAIKNLPTDPSWQTRVPATEKSQHIRSKSGVSEGQSESSEDTGCHPKGESKIDASSCKDSPYGMQRQKKAPPITAAPVAEDTGVEPATLAGN